MEVYFLNYVRWKRLKNTKLLLTIRRRTNGSQAVAACIGEHSVGAAQVLSPAQSSVAGDTRVCTATFSWHDNRI